MAAARGKRNEPGLEPEPEAPEDGPSRVSELLERALGAGLAGFFTTEAALRKAVSESLPRDWVDFASDQSERTRAELIERLAAEIGRRVDHIDVAELLDQVLEGYTMEVNARIRFEPREGRSRTRDPDLKRGREGRTK